MPGSSAAAETAGQRAAAEAAGQRKPKAPAARIRAWKPIVAAALGYAVLTIVLTYPGAAHLGTRMIGDGGDGHQFAWNLWWMKRALVDLGVSPFFTDAIYHPGGVTLWLHTLSPMNGLLSIPLQAVLPLPVVYNLVLLFSFAAAGVGAYLLAYDATASRQGAFLAGLVFTFSSYHFAHARGHLNLVACQWLPMFALFWIRTVRDGGLVNAILAAVFFAFNAYSDTYYLLYALLLGPMLLVAYYRRGGAHQRALAILVAMASGAVLTGPYVWGMIRVASSEPFLGAHPADVFSADLTAYFVPNSVSSFGGLTRGIWSRWSGNTTENACFIGYSVLAACVVGLVRERAARAWGVIGFVFFVLSLGPELRVLGQETGIVLHYALLHRFVPFFDLTGVPVRMDVMVELSAAMLVAYAMRGTPRAAVAVFGAAVLIERLALPYPTSLAVVDSFYRDLARDPEEYALLDVDNRPSLAMYAATVHRKPIVGGMVARLPAAAQQFLDQTPALPTLLYGHPLAAGDTALLGRKMCERLQVRFVTTGDPSRRDIIAKTLQLPLWKETGGLTVFECPRR